MARIPDWKRIKREDFAKDEQALVDRLAYPLNSLADQLRVAFNKNLNFDNLNQELVIIDVKVDASGNPLVETKFKTIVKGKVRGTTCIKADNITAPSSYVTQTPFMNFTQNSGIVTVNNITGLTANSRYKLTFLVIGE